MRVHIDINIPYSLKEIFSPAARHRASELRAASAEVFGKEGAARFICQPNINLGKQIPLQLSVSSPDNHQKAMTYINQVKYGVYV